MSFGEHLEELRSHLIRAMVGIFLALFVTAYFGDVVVKILTEPVERQLEPWIRNQLAKGVVKFKAKEDLLPKEKREQVAIEAELSAKDLENLAKRLGNGNPVPGPAVRIHLHVPVSDMLAKIAEPLAEVDRRWSLKSLSAQEAFVIYFKAVLGASVVVASPWVFYQLYAFVAVGLYAHERRFVMYSLPFSVLLFLLGVFTCYFLVFPRMLSFFLWTNEWLDIVPDIRLNEWVGFSVILMLIFGAGFQLPLFMLLLERVGVITHEMMAKQRRVAILVIAVVSAVVTPGGDPFTMIFLAIPLALLFELGLFLMQYFRHSNPFAVNERELDEIHAEI